MMKRCFSASITALAAAATRSVAFSSQERTLAAQAEAKGYKATVWFTDDDLKLINTTPKDGEKPTSSLTSKRLELYNVDQLVAAPKDLPTATENTSVVTKKPYGKRIAFELEQRRVLKQFRSSWWISKGEIKKQGLMLRGGERPTTTLITVKADFYNAEQLKDQTAALSQPFSAGSKKPYVGSNADLLRGHIQRNGFKLPLYLSIQQAEKFNVAIKENSVGCALTPKEQVPAKLFNIAEIENAEALQAQFPVPTAGDHTYFPSGRPVTYAPLAQRMQEAVSASNFPKKLWLSEYEIQRIGAQLKAGAVGILNTYVDRYTKESVVYNVEQTTNPEVVIRAAGTLVR